MKKAYLIRRMYWRLTNQQVELARYGHNPSAILPTTVTAENSPQNTLSYQYTVNTNNDHTVHTAATAIPDYTYPDYEISTSRSHR